MTKTMLLSSLDTRRAGMIAVALSLAAGFVTACSSADQPVESDETELASNQDASWPTNIGEQAFFCTVAATRAQDSLPESDLAGRLRAQLREMQMARIAVELDGAIDNPGYEANLLAGRARREYSENPERFSLDGIADKCGSSFPQTLEQSAKMLPVSDLESASICIFTLEMVSTIGDGQPASNAEISKITQTESIDFPRLQALAREALNNSGVDSEDKLYQFQDIAIGKGYAISPPEQLMKKCRDRFGA
jgi:hypothetical protein